jgi:fructose-1,6-bisphosphatase I
MPYLSECLEKEASAEVAAIVSAVSAAVLEISTLLGRGALALHLADAGATNVQGETQKKLDVIANELMAEAASRVPALAGFASEELEAPQRLNPEGKYLLLFDPLDGSSNIDVDVSIGTIFSILPVPEGADLSTDEGFLAAFLQPGRRQAAAGYALYGPSTELVLSLGQGVSVFTQDRAMGFCRRSRKDVAIPEETAEFAINASNQRHWLPPVQRYIGELLAGKTGPRQKDFNMRWIASMVADVHRILMRGGIFLYPVDARILDKGGRLRLMYEANPMAFLAEQAGGAASTGTSPILDIAPQKLHQRVQVILGSKNEVAAAVACHG